MRDWSWIGSHTTLTASDETYKSDGLGRIVIPQLTTTIPSQPTMSSVEMMKDPLRVGKAIRAQLENEIPKDLPLEKDFRVCADVDVIY